MKSRWYIVAALLLALSAPAARAQEAAPTLQEDPRAAKFKDVERGFFVGFDLGFLSFFKTPTADVAAHPYAGTGGGASRGVIIGANAGLDIVSRLAVSVFIVGANERASVDYGAFALYAAGLDLRFAPWSMRDRNGWERLFAYVHVRGGVGRTWPEGLFGDSEKLIAGGVGIEYYTRLRHFSVGAAVDLERAVVAKTFGVALYPTVRYTF